MKKVNGDELHWARGWRTWLGTVPLRRVQAACHAVTQRKQGAVTRGEPTASHPRWIGLPWLAGASCGVQFWARNPCWRPQRIWGEGGSANLAAALRVWQTWDFSSALCLAKPKMCSARNPPLIFKPLCIFYINLIHMFFIYFYLTHQIELGATMMKGTVLISKKIFEPFFLELNHLFPPTVKTTRLSWVWNLEPKCEIKIHTWQRRSIAEGRS